MSWQAQQWAFEHAPMLTTDKGSSDPTTRLVLAALAYHADKDGRNAHPSLVRLQYETGLSRNTLLRSLRKLTTAGLIAEDGYGPARHDGHAPRRYRLCMDKIRDAAELDALRAVERDRLTRSRKTGEAPQKCRSEAPQKGLTNGSEAPQTSNRGTTDVQSEAPQRCPNHQENHQENHQQRAAGTSVSLHPTDPEPTPGQAIVDAWHRTTGHPYPRTRLAELARIADELLADGADPNYLALALDDWHNRGKSPNFLRYSYDDALKTHRATYIPQRPTGRGAKAQGWLELGRRVQAEQDRPPTGREAKAQGWLAMKGQMSPAREKPATGRGAKGRAWLELAAAMEAEAANQSQYDPNIIDAEVIP